MIFLYSVVILTFCQNVQSFFAVNITHAGYNDNYLGHLSKVDYLLDTKIAGGAYARDGQFPFMAVVHHLMGEGTISQCGGTILSSRWVLTAGHCIVNHPRKFFVVFGIINKSNLGYDHNNGPGVSMITTQGTLHPQYSETVNDIGLLYMPHNIPFSNTIQPIKLPGYGYTKQSFMGKIGYIVGWGREQKNNMGGTVALKYTTLPIISNSECEQYWDATDKNICTTPGLGQDACEGDSGGPLIVFENNQAFQVGIVSYGDSQCPSKRPRVFTRVTSFTRWIQIVTHIRILSFI